MRNRYFSYAAHNGFRNPESRQKHLKEKCFREFFLSNPPVNRQLLLQQQIYASGAWERKAPAFRD